MSGLGGMVSFSSNWFAACSEAAASRLTPLLDESEAALDSGLQTDLMGPALFGVTKVTDDSPGFFSRLIVHEEAGIMMACNGAADAMDFIQLENIPLHYRAAGLDSLRNLTGNFCGALWDVETAALVLFKSPGSGAPLSYSVQEQTVRFTSRQPASNDDCFQSLKPGELVRLSPE